MPAETPDNPPEKLNPRTVRRLLKLVRPYLGGAVLILVLIGFDIGLRVVALDLMRVGINRLPMIHQSRDTEQIGPILTFLAILSGAYVAAQAGRFLVTNRIRVARTHFGTRILWDLRNKIYDRLQRLSFRFFDENQSGQLINRATGDVNTVRRFFMMVSFSVVTLILYLVFYATRLLMIRWDLALLCLTPVPLTVVLLMRFGRKIRVRFREARTSSDLMANALQENVAGVQVVKAFAREEAEKQKYGERTEDVYQKVLAVVRTFRDNLPMINGISQCSQVIMLGAGAWMIMQTPPMLLVGDLMFFSLALGALMEQMRMVTNMTNVTQEAATSADRVFEILDAVPDVDERPHAPPLPRGSGGVVFENINFGYDEKNRILHDISLTVEPGEIIALVGPTGSGKSSLTNLIPRFYDPQSGRVLLDGADVRDVRLRSLRDAVGLVFQDTFLFSTTLAENIGFGVPDATGEDIERAARIARVHDFIAQLEDGYNTIIGERGVTLSGGQRQRVAIARAILKDPRVLILDDATASVDASTENEIQEALNEVMRSRTTFIIAHRMSTVHRADRVVVIENGRITQVGTHAELFASDGHYREMCLLQLQDTLGEDGVQQLAADAARKTTDKQGKDDG